MFHLGDDHLYPQWVVLKKKHSNHDVSNHSRPMRAVIVFVLSSERDWDIFRTDSLNENVLLQLTKFTPKFLSSFFHILHLLHRC